jgi:hypothetical protein
MEHGQHHAWGDFNPQIIASFNPSKRTKNLGSVQAACCLCLPTGGGGRTLNGMGVKNSFKYLLFVQLTTEVHVLSYTSPAYPNSQYSLDINV